MAGIVGVGVWAAGNLAPKVWQGWGNWSFDQQVAGKIPTVKKFLEDKSDRITAKVESWFGYTGAATRSVAPSTAPASAPRLEQPSAPLAENTLIGRLTIPRLNLSTIVREGVSQSTLSLAVGHIPGTALPGQSGNVAVAGHRDTLFLGLKGILPNDLVRFETLHGNYEYRVESTEIVTPRDVGVLKAGLHPELTLVTCYPFNYIGSAPDRFIIKALEVSRTPEAEVPESAKAQLKQQMDAAPKPGQARKRAESTGPDSSDKVQFEVARYHSQTLAPGISIGIDTTDPEDGRVNGWMWIMPDRRTIWLHDQRIADPVVFYGHDDGKRRELLITRVTNHSASGYLLMN